MAIGRRTVPDLLKVIARAARPDAGPAPEEVLRNFLQKPFPFERNDFLSPKKEAITFELRRLTAIAMPSHGPALHPALSLLSQLLITEEPYDAVIDIRSISSISASRGELINDLDSLPETATLKVDTDSTFGPVNFAQLRTLRRAVYKEFDPSSTSVGVFSIYERSWDNHRTAPNDGASRRFAYWRRLAQLPGVPRFVQARITRLRLNEQAFTELDTKWRVLAMRSRSRYSNDDLLLRQAWPEGFAVIPRGPGGDQQYWIIPRPHTAPFGLGPELAALHTQIDLQGIPDPLRLIAEQMASVQNSPRPLKRDRKRTVIHPSQPRLKMKATENGFPLP